eukprot:7411335-Alexandrium_andersonii.AAC.1
MSDCCHGRKHWPSSSWPRIWGMWLPMALVKYSTPVLRRDTPPNPALRKVRTEGDTTHVSWR